MGLTQPPRKIEPSSQDLQVVFGGKYIAKTSTPLLVWEDFGPPRYYVPRKSILFENAEIVRCSEEDNAVNVGGGKEVEYDKKSDLHYFPEVLGTTAMDHKMIVGEKSMVVTVFSGGALDGYVRLKFFEMDAWIEAGALTRLPPKVAGHQVTTVESTEHIVVTVRGTILAETHHAIKMFETGLPPRYYLPADSVVDWSALKESRAGRLTACPYKGEARYFDIEFKGERWDDVVWYYLYPIGESAAVAGKLAFTLGKEGIKVTADGLELTDETVMHTISLGKDLRPQ